jgi:hypothetical protein
MGRRYLSRMSRIPRHASVRNSTEGRKPLHKRRNVGEAAGFILLGGISHQRPTCTNAKAPRLTTASFRAVCGWGYARFFSKNVKTLPQPSMACCWR